MNELPFQRLPNEKPLKPLPGETILGIHLTEVRCYWDFI